MAETWVINEDCLLRLWADSTIFQPFTSNGIYVTSTKDEPISKKFNLYYNDILVAISSDMTTVTQWIDQAYRTITFETAPTGDLLTWLQNNATKQSSSLTDLTGTTWVFNDTITFIDAFSYDITFTSNNLTYTHIELRHNTKPEEYFTLQYYSDNSNFETVFNSNNGWFGEAYKTITITGGNNVTDTTLINWLQANATLQETPAVDLTNTTWVFNEKITSPTVAFNFNFTDLSGKQFNGMQKGSNGLYYGFLNDSGSQDGLLAYRSSGEETSE